MTGPAKPTVEELGIDAGSLAAAFELRARCHITAPAG
jgi:hypothetical protein